MTAAPGPQQPDEVRPRISTDLYGTLRAAAIDLGMVHGRPDLGRELRTLIDWHETRPAAPSAQPDEVDVDCDHAWAEHDPEVGCLHADPAGPWLVVTVCRCKRTKPSQPVRDTGETRTGATIDFTGRPTHYDESRDRECPGTTTYAIGDREAACDTCGGRTGWIAAAAEEHARLAQALRDFPQQEYVEFAQGRAARRAT